MAELRMASKRTVQHTLQKCLNMPSQMAALKPLLMEKKKANRVKFAETYKHIIAKDWSKVLCSDKSIFKCIRASRCNVRRPNRNSRYKSKNTIKTVKDPNNVMVYGCFSSSLRRGRHYFLLKSTTENGEQYQAVLESQQLHSVIYTAACTFSRMASLATPLSTLQCFLHSRLSSGRLAG
jgi:hypothetical protein